jgi:hypothetical protein
MQSCPVANGSVVSLPMPVSACVLTYRRVLLRCLLRCSYGPTAWWWEAQELVRKLLLTGLVVSSRNRLQSSLQHLAKRFL